MNDIKTESAALADDAESPLCLHCLEAIDPLDKTCPHCGGAVGQLTPYLPYESIRWQTDIWGRMWHQAWSPTRSIAGRLLRLAVIVLFVPILLVGLLPIAWRRLRGAAA